MNLNSWESHAQFYETKRMFNLGIGSEQFFTALEQSLPEVFSRRTASNAIGNLISTKTLANLDAMGRGPRVKLNIGRRVAYEKQSFLQWLRERVQA